jgi:hypothetical protein
LSKYYVVSKIENVFFFFRRLPAVPVHQYLVAY